MIDVRIKNIEDSDADTLLSEDVDFQGNMNLSRPAMIKGQVTGKIESVSNVFIEGRYLVGLQPDRKRLRRPLPPGAELEGF